MTQAILPSDYTYLAQALDQKCFTMSELIDGFLYEVHHAIAMVHEAIVDFVGVSKAAFYSQQLDFHPHQLAHQLTQCIDKLLAPVVRLMIDKNNGYTDAEMREYYRNHSLCLCLTLQDIYSISGSILIYPYQLADEVQGKVQRYLINLQHHCQQMRYLLQLFDAAILS